MVGPVWRSAFKKYMQARLGEPVVISTLERLERTRPRFAHPEVYECPWHNGCPNMQVSRVTFELSPKGHADQTYSVAAAAALLAA